MKEFVDFLGRHAPYDALPGDLLDTLARTIEVEFFPAGTTVVERDGPVIDRIHVIRSGEAEVLDVGRVVDLLDEGDSFGHVSLLSGLPPAVSVRAVGDLLCYSLPDPRSLLPAGALQFRGYGQLANRERLSRTASSDVMNMAVSAFMRPPLWADATATVREAARAMSDGRESCVLTRIGEDVGIATDSDFRRAIGERSEPGAEALAVIATAPAVAIDDTTLVAEALITMIRHNVHHLVVTGAAARPVGVIRIVDVTSTDVREPLVLQSALNAARSLTEVQDTATLLPATVVELWKSGLPATHVGELLSAVIESIMRRVFDFTPDDDDLPPSSWMVLGSLGRREPLPLSDIDSAMVWAGAASTENRLGFRTLANSRLNALEAGGFRRCPDGANATNPLFARSLSEWQDASSSWITDPGQENALLWASMVADSRPINNISLGRRVTDALVSRSRNRPFIELLMRETLLHRPPVGFVRDFVVESSGAHRGRLDLKAGGLVPIASIGRWIAVVLGDDRGSTPVRLRKGERAGLLTTDEADVLVAAFEDIYGLLLDFECRSIIDNVAGSTWIDPKGLDTLTRRKLRETFRAITDVQTALEGGWPSRLPW